MSTSRAQHLSRMGRFRNSSIFRRIGSVTKSTFALVGVGTVLSAAYEYREYKSVQEETGSETVKGKDKKKRALVLPFHRMRIVERKKPNLLSLSSLRNSLADEEQIEVEIRDLVNVIHAAAEDPTIVSLYGTFGQGFRFDCGGYAHVEELRNAIRVFNESHRQHHDPSSSPDAGGGDTADPIPTDSQPANEKHEKQEKQEQKAKYSYAFADTFDDPNDSANKEYFLASAFSHIHLQPRGNLNFFGVATSSLFLRQALDKYGIKAHVFKHGVFKNAPNLFTEKGYTKEHFENTKSLIDSLNNTMCNSIVHSRGVFDTLNSSILKMIRDYGTMTADNAREIGLIDFTPRVDPLYDLVFANKNEDALQSMRDKWNQSLDFDKFKANETISLSAYSSLLKKREKVNNKKWKFHETLTKAANSSVAAEALLAACGYKGPHFNIHEAEYKKEKGKQTKEKVAIVHVNGSINDDMARSVTNTFRKIKIQEDVKCVVLRIDSPGGSVTASETILEEYRNLPQPVICSFSNLAASGGYYIATGSDRIFASPTTITGSIGVFGVKFDMSELLGQYGVNVEHVASGKHALTYSLSHPLAKDMHINLSRNVNRIYDYFKEIVASARKMSPEEVEAVAQGRVWTGEQAKENGLIDEFGGIDRALSYAIRNHTSTGAGEVEVWPKPLTFKERLMKVANVTGDSDDRNSSLLSMLFGILTTNNDVNTPYTEMQNQDYIKLILSGHSHMPRPFNLPVNGSCTHGVMLTMDETSAIKMALFDSFK